MELKIVAKHKAMPKIEWNYEDLKKQLTELLSTVKVDPSAELDEESYKLAKSRRAEARKMLDAMDNQRKSIEKEYLAEYSVFKDEYGILKSLVNEYIIEADTYAKRYENQWQNERSAEIEKIYLTNIGEFEQDVPLDKIFKKTWLNKSTSLKEVEFELRGKALEIRESVHSIKKLQSDWESTLLMIYFDTLSLPTVLSRKKQLEELEARKQKETEREELHQEYLETKAEKYVVSIQFSITDYQLDDLLEYCKNEGIEYFV